MAKPCHPRPLQRQVDLGICDTRHVLERAFHTGRATAARHAGNIKINPRRLGCVAGIFDRLHQRCRRNTARRHLRPLGREIDTGSANTVQTVKRFFRTRRTARTTHAVNGKSDWPVGHIVDVRLSGHNRRVHSLAP